MQVLQDAEQISERALTAFSIASRPGRLSRPFEPLIPASSNTLTICQRERFTTGTRTQSRFLKIKLASALFNLGHVDGTGQRPDLGTGRNSPLAESI